MVSIHWNLNGKEFRIHSHSKEPKALIFGCASESAVRHHCEIEGAGTSGSHVQHSHLPFTQPLVDTDVCAMLSCI